MDFNTMPNTRTPRYFMRIWFAVRNFNFIATKPILKMSPNMEIDVFPTTYDFEEAMLGLCHNKAFIEEVQRVRDLLGIPAEGLNYFKDKDKSIDKALLADEVERLKNDYEMTSFLTVITQANTVNLENIIVYNFVDLVREKEEVLFYPFLDENDSDIYADRDAIPGLVFKICKPTKISTMFAAIREHWPRIEEEMKRMTIRKGRWLYPENMKILELINNEKLTYTEAGREMDSLNPKGNNDRHSIRMRYNRSMQKINKLFYKK